MVLSHVGLQRFVPGIFGVNVFFFVSGFLITRLLLAEAARDGRVDLGRFWARRALRLYPALVVAVLGGGVAFAALGGRLLPGDVAAALLYAANWWEIAGGFESGVPGVAHPYGILWSLAVEEHFYLFAPLLGAFSFSRWQAKARATVPGFAGAAAPSPNPLPQDGRGLSRLLVATLAGIVAVTAWRVHLALGCAAGEACHEMRILHGTDTRIDSILYGVALTAALASPWTGTVLRVVRHPACLPGGLALIVGSLLVRDPMFRDTVRFTVQGCGLVLCVGAVLFGAAPGWVRRGLASRPARVLGEWSYSLYLWHWIVLMVAVRLLPPGLRDGVWTGTLPCRVWPLFAVPVVAASLACAALSYRAVERPLRDLRRRFGSGLSA